VSPGFVIQQALFIWISSLFNTTGSISIVLLLQSSILIFQVFLDHLVCGDERRMTLLVKRMTFRFILKKAIATSKTGKKLFICPFVTLSKETGDE
jgi:hypothetical protein